MTEAPRPVESATAAPEPILRRIQFSDVSGWADDNHAAALAAFTAGARLIADTPPQTRALGVSGLGLQRVAREALAGTRPASPIAAREFFERSFLPHRIDRRGFVTGYYEPVVEASRVPTERFSVPLLRRPGDLVEVRDENRPPGWDPEMRFARRSDDGLVPFFDRTEIEEGALAGRGLELAYLEGPVEAFFIHVQGSARLNFSDGGAMRIAFDGKAGHSYTSIGRLAVERGILPRGKADKDGLEAWLKSHPKEGLALMRENRSYIFFRETAIAEDDGPLGAAGVSLLPYRSLAVDRTLHTFHTPIFVEAPELADPEREGREFRRLMIAQDTGSAIIGPARGDIFFGSGPAAGSRAGRVSHSATMIALLPREGAT